MSDKRCRICLVYLNWNSSRVDIFCEQNIHLVRQIYSLTGVQLSNIDQPRHMCITCLMNLGIAIKFRQRCILSQKQFIIRVGLEPLDSNKHDVNENIEEDYDQAKIQNLGEDSDSQIDYYFTTTEEIEDNNVEQSDMEPKIVDRVKNHLKSKKEATSCKLGRNTSKYIRQFVCDECGKKLSSISNFREHKLRHAGIKSFICKLCLKGFITHKELTRHTRRHTGERPYACSYCTSRFSDHGSFRQHERRHTNSRPFVCIVCGKRFFSSNCLSKHRLRHQLLPRTHHCTICDIWFQRPDHLTAHMKCRNHKLKEHLSTPTT
ncbi:hypothetical protein ACLKA7_008404 [Drosophila subpalustris]